MPVILLSTIWKLNWNLRFHKSEELAQGHSAYEQKSQDMIPRLANTHVHNHYLTISPFHSVNINKLSSESFFLFKRIHFSNLILKTVNFIIGYNDKCYKI